MVDGVVWAGAATLLAMCAAVLWTVTGGVGVAAAPFDAGRRFTLSPWLLPAAGVTLAVVAGVRAGVVERAPWRLLLALSWLATTSWVVALSVGRGRSGLTANLRRPGGLLVEALSVHGHPNAFVRAWTLHRHPVAAARTSPPGGALLVAALRSWGLRDVTSLAVVLTALGCLAVPFVGIATRSLCHDRAGRRILALLTLAPFWIAGTAMPFCLAAATAAAGIACAVAGSEPHRHLGARRGLAVLAGLLLGATALLDYPAALLGVSAAAVYFVRRQPGLIVLSALCMLVPLGVAAHAGFGFSGGVSVARHDVGQLVDPERSVLLWLVLELLALLLVCGPLAMTACRGIARTPGWPFLLGAAAAVAFSVGTNLVRGGIERAWLPELVWLLVPAVAPLVRPAENTAPDAPDASPLPLGLLVAGAAVAMMLRLVLAGPL